MAGWEKIGALVILGAGLFASLPLGAQVWDGGAGTGTWATANNWNPNAVPGSGANVSFNAASDNNQSVITLGNTSRTVGSVTFVSAGGANSFTFNAGTAVLTINSSGGIVNNDTATQIFNVPISVSAAQTWNAASGGLTVTNVTLAASTLTLSGGSDIAITGRLTNSGGNRTITNNSSGAVTINNINLSNNATNRTLTIGGTGNTTVTGVISNATSSASALTKTGTGTLTLSGANTYTGATTVSAGTLQLGASNVLSNSTAVTVASGATLNLNNYSDTIGSLAGAGTLTLGSGTLIAGGNNTSTTFSGAFTAGDTGTFQKAGTGTLTFGAGMDLSGGTLVLSGGTLNLGGFDSTFGSLSVSANSILDFGTSGSSILNILNSLTVNSGVTLTIANWTDTVDYFYSLTNPGSTNLGRIVFSGFSGTDTKWQSFDNQITPVPEPAAYGAMLLALSVLFAGWRRFRRRTA
jgi:fibronectin-binding autotransporter adhesin